MENKKNQSSANTLNDFGNHVERFAVKTAESIKKVIDKALSSRNTVLTIRVNDESNKKINMLVDAGLFRSRSESCAFLIQEGIKNQEPLFKKITEKLHKMEKIKDELKDIISEELTAKKTQKK
jgi:Arc/MetJ-type ribon-helix-helix transcriptional regulator